ncbi:leucine-rich repeat-containing protein 41 isoform X2 [Cyprinodon tularosa]|uniref:leucine-rich repeat-containing protein 41 isoform X2 n=1 Tax=Cyprinodon tularosa TaxID=77115 RepID=UPI0018E27DD7|nr:leucine-rich repeat-containing protein 41 isoform X2 [Cyprinodon tularosa]
MEARERKIRLQSLCFQAVRKHFASLGTEAVLDLPEPLIKELLPFLTVCQLDEVQRTLNRRGFSTFPRWLEVLQQLVGSSRALDFRTEEDAKHEVMLRLFTAVLYGLTNGYVLRNSAHLKSSSFLRAAARSVRHFILMPPIHEALQTLTSDGQHLLALLEKNIRSVHVSSLCLTDRRTQAALYVLHRLLDHGLSTHLMLSVHCPLGLAWLLQGRGSRYVDPELEQRMCCGGSAKADRIHEGPGAEPTDSDAQRDPVSPCKRAKMEEDQAPAPSFDVSPQLLCRTFSPCDAASAGACPFGRITRLEIRSCGRDSLRVLSFYLPTFFCLQSLTLHSTAIFREPQVSAFAAALKQLSDASRSGLVHLNVGILPCIGLLKTLLTAGPRLQALCVEFQEALWGPQCLLDHAEPHMADLPLEKLTVKVSQLQTDADFLTSVLRRCPRLTWLHVAGIRLPTGSSQSGLLRTLSEYNRCLKVLILEDIKLCDCLPDVLKLLRGCRLEELRLTDCRLLEKCGDPGGSLVELVSALKIPSLHSLGLAQNRLAKNVCELAELFCGASQSSLRLLDIRSNFIQPADLLRFADRLRVHRPPHRLTLDLRKNPGDRDPETWSAALQSLQPFSHPLVEGWSSTDTMADHVSNM